MVTNALAKQRYKSAICIFSYCMDRKHAVSSRSVSLTAYSRLSLSLLPLSFLFYSINRFVSQQMGLKNLHCQPFSQQYHPHAYEEAKRWKENSALAHAHANIFNDALTHRINIHRCTQVLRDTKLLSADSSTETQSHAQTECQRGSLT